jgi:hypothetical protein
MSTPMAYTGIAEVDLVNLNREHELGRLAWCQLRIDFVEEVGIALPPSQVVVGSDAANVDAVVEGDGAVTENGVDVAQRLFSGVHDGAGEDEVAARRRDSRIDCLDGRESSRTRVASMHGRRAECCHRSCQRHRDEHGPKRHDGSASCSNWGSRSSSLRSDA